MWVDIYKKIKYSIRSSCFQVGQKNRKRSIFSSETTINILTKLCYYSDLWQQFWMYSMIYAIVMKAKNYS